MIITNIILIAIACIVVLGFLATFAMLEDIRDRMTETNGHVEKLADEIVDDDEIVEYDQ